jgi:transposase InsO family protein
MKVFDIGKGCHRLSKGAPPELNQKEFDRLRGQSRKIRLFVLPPKSPRLSGGVERAHRTHTEEFYEVYEVPWNVTDLNLRLQKWEYVYNCIRPHQALNYKTPLQFSKDNGIVSSDYSSNLSHM